MTNDDENDMYLPDGKMHERYKGTLAYDYAELGVAWREFEAAWREMLKPLEDALLSWWESPATQEAVRKWREKHR